MFWLTPFSILWAVRRSARASGLKAAGLGAPFLAPWRPAKALEEAEAVLSRKQNIGNLGYKIAQLTAARAYAAEGDKGRARELYQELLAAWKNADPGLPLVEKARAEYAKLQ